MTTIERGLDIQIAQRIMGWGHILDPLGTMFGQPMPGKQTEPWQSGIPYYSTQIQDAWLIVEHLRSQGWDYELLNDGNRHYAVFSKKTEDAYSASADTAAAAIVAAALKAVEEQP